MIGAVMCTTEVGPHDGYRTTLKQHSSVAVPLSSSGECSR